MGDRVLISWSVPNLITIWLMLFLGLFILAFGSQLALKSMGNSGGDNVGNNAGGF